MMCRCLRNPWTRVLIILAVAIVMTWLVWSSKEGWSSKDGFKLPSWALSNTKWPANNDTAQSAYKQNVKDVATANASNKKYDVVLYGDSITAGFRWMLQKNPTWLKKYLDVPEFAAFGVPGNRVEDLAWRLMGGTEKLIVDPSVVVLWIGTNNLRFNEKPEIHLEELIVWMKGAMPSSKIVLMALTPRTKYDVKPTNEKYSKLASKLGVTFAPCGTDINPNDTKMLPDGLHLAEPAYAAVFKCLGPIVAKVLKAQPLLDPLTAKSKAFMDAK